MLGQIRDWRKRLTQSGASRRNRLRDALGLTHTSRRGLRAGFERLEPRLLLAAITPPPGLVGWWSGDGHADDVTGQYDGTMHGGVTFEQGMVGQAFRLDGSDDWISANQTFANDQSHTIEAWVNWNGSGQQLQEIVSWWNTSDSVANRMFLGTAGSGIRYGDGWTGTGVTLPANRWVHVAATYDGATNDRRLFLDGQQVAAIGNTAEARFSSFLAIGRQGNAQTAGEYWNGLIDELSIYNRALDASEIAAVFAAGAAGKAKPPTEIHGTLWHDLDGNGTQDSGEPRLAGWTVYLDLNNDSVLDAGEPTAVTLSDDPATAGANEAGTYAFTGLEAGTYTVRQVVPPGWAQTLPGLSFAAAANFPVAGGANSIANGDLDGDGDVDIVTADSSNGVSLLRNDGQGSFGPRQVLSTGGSFRSITTADFDNDGDTDVVAINFAESANNVVVMLNNGDATFSAAATYSAGTGAFFVAAGDLNGDAFSDLAVANQYSNNVSVLHNLGNGSFAPAAHYASGTRAAAVSISDLNADGQADLAVANYGAGTASVLFNDGVGGFLAPSHFSAGQGPVKVSAADFDVDGDADLAVLNLDSASVSVLPNDGSGGFGPPTRFAIGALPHGIAAADLDRDGYIDLVSANVNSNTVSILLNDRSGGFRRIADPPTAAAPHDVTAADFDGDGDFDLATANWNAASTSVFQNQLGSGRQITLSAGEAGADVDFANVTDGSLANSPPAAQAGGAYTVTVDGAVQLDGSSSSDAEQAAATLTYLWDLDGDGIFGEAGPAAARGDENGAMPTFQAAGLSQGISFMVTLRVLDDGGLAHEDTATVEVVKPAVHWDGGAGTLNWHDELNWSTDVVPGATDDVLIDMADSDIVVQLSGAAAVKSLRSEESLSLSGSSATLTVTDHSVINGVLTLEGGVSLRAQGPNASFTANGQTNLNAPNLYASGGGLLDLSGAVQYLGTWITTTIRADGPGSRINLSGVSDFVGGGYGWGTVFYTNIEAAGGGHVDLSDTVAITNYARFTASGHDPAGAASYIDLTSLDRTEAVRAPVILQVYDVGVIHAPAVTTLGNTSLYASDGGRLSMATVTSYHGGVANSHIRASGFGSRIDLSGVSDFVGGGYGWGTVFYTNIEAAGGGRVDLSNTVAITNYARFTASGQDPSGAASYIDLTSLDRTGALRSPVILQVYDVGVIHAPAVTTLGNTSLYASDGGRLSMSTVTSYQGGIAHSHIRAAGSGSHIDLSGVSDFVGGGYEWGTVFYTNIEAAGGGRVDLSNTVAITNYARFTASGQDPAGAASYIDLTSLDRTGAIRAPVILQVYDVGVIHVPVLRTLQGTSLVASRGGQLPLPAVISYTGGPSIDTSIQSDDSGSLIDLSSLTSFAGSTGSHNWGVYAVRVTADGGGNVALGGGTVSLSDTVWLSAATGSITGGVLELAPTANVTAAGTLTANVINRGRMDVGSGFGALTIDGGFHQTDTGTLSLQIGDPTAVLVDTMAILGTATLDGTLSITRPSGYQPASDDHFAVLSFQTRVCDFATKTGLELGNGLFLRAEYGQTAMELVAGSTADSGSQCAPLPEFTDIRVGPNPAKAGDPLSITFNFNTPLQADPMVTVDGNAATLVTRSDSLYTYSYLVTGAETEGPVDVSIAGTNREGQDGSSAATTTLDFTPPVIPGVTISPTPVALGDPLTITLVANEPLSDHSIVTVGGQEAMLLSVNGLEYTYQRLITGGEGVGTVPVEIIALDLAGNSGGASSEAELRGGGLSVGSQSIHFSKVDPDVGDQVTATVTVRNQSSTDAVNVPLRFALLEPGGVVRLLDQPTVALIPSGGQATVDVSFAVRAAGVQLFEVRVDPENTIDEDTKSDNTASRSLVTTPIVFDAHVVPESVLPGGRVTVTGTAHYDSPFGTLGVAAAAQVTASVVGSSSTTVTANGDGQFSIELAAPVTPGDYLIELRATDGSSNGSDVLRLSVLGPPAGTDFSPRFGTVNFSNHSPAAGEPVTISVLVDNLGADDFTGTANVSFYEGATLLGVSALTDLAAGDTQTVSIAHAFAAAGPHTVRVVVDPLDRVSESREDNNVATAILHVLPPLADPTPIDILFSDLTPSSIQGVTITALVRNLGGDGAENVQVQFLDNGLVIGTQTIATIAAAGGLASVSIDTVLSPAGLHDVQIVVDPSNTTAEADETNNFRSQPILVHDPAPDLAPFQIVLSSTPMMVDVSATATVTVRNQGERQADAFDVQFLQDGVVVSTQRVPSLAINHAVTLTTSTRFDVTGMHELSVVVDPAGEVVELAETNNQSTMQVSVVNALLPDLQVSAAELGMSTTKPAAGQLVTVSVPVHNPKDRAADDVEVRLVINGATASSTTIDTLAAGASATVSLQFVAPAVDGYHLLEIVADPDNTIGETAENNNSGFRLFLVGATPDLLVSGIGFSNSDPREGEFVTVTAVVENLGQLDAQGVTLSFFDGADPFGSVSGLTLAAGERRSVSASFATTARVGERSIRVAVDPADVVPETDETNNDFSALLTVLAMQNLPPVLISPIDDQNVKEDAVPTILDVSAVFDDGDIASQDDRIGLDVSGNTNPGLVTASVSGTTLTLTYAPHGYGTAQITLRATDLEGAFVEDTIRVTVDPVNDAPLALAGSHPEVLEGAVVMFDGRGSSDIDGDPLTYAWDFGDGTTATGPTPSHPFADNGTYSIELTVFDGLASASDTLTLVVANVSPAASFGNNGPIDEGSPVTVSFSDQFDPSPADTIAGFRYSYALTADGLASSYADASTEPVRDFTFDDNGQYTVYGRIIDKDGDYRDYTTTVTVDNVAPVAVLDDNGPVNEGSAVTVSFAGQSDPSSADSIAGFRYSYALTTDGLASSYADASTEPLRDFTFDDNGQYTVYARIIDKDGGYRDYTTTVTVDNVAPIAVLDDNGPVNEGSAVTVSFAGQSDPSLADSIAGFRYSYALTTDGLASSYADASAEPLRDFTFDDNGQYTVYGRIIDKDGGYSDYTTMVTVDNVAPTASVSGPAFVVRGQTLALTLGASDPSATDQTAGFTYTIQWNDGGSTATALGAAGTVVEHVFTDTGSYTVRVFATDKDGGAGEITELLITVGSVGLQDDPCHPGQQALFVGGTTAGDILRVTPGGSEGSVEVFINGLSHGQHWPESRIVLFGQSGDDDLEFAGSVDISGWLYGGDGNDRLKGGAGNGVLLGEGGDDLLVGGGRRDLLVGGEGADRIVGAAEDDILIAGNLSFADRTRREEMSAAYCAIMAEWTSPHDYYTRIENLVGAHSETDTERLNGSVYLQMDQTVRDDEDVSRDVITGASGDDWFFFWTPEDRTTDLKDEVFAEDLDWILAG